MLLSQRPVTCAARPVRSRMAVRASASSSWVAVPKSNALTEELVNESRAPNVDAKGKAVLVAVDKSSKEHPLRALSWCLDHLVKPGDTVHILTVIPIDETNQPSAFSPVALSTPSSSTIDRDILESATASSMELLDKATKMVQQAEGVHSVSHVLVERTWETVGQALCSKAEELDAAMLVVASSGKNLVRVLRVGTVPSQQEGSFSSSLFFFLLC